MPAALSRTPAAAGLIEHLVLGDSVLVLDRADGAPLVVSDPREVVISRSYRSALEAAAAGSDEYHRVLRDLRANRNRPGGFWVAKDDPRAADEAVTGSCPISELTGAVLLSNGASRIVDRFRLAGWPGVMAVLASNGPAEIIRRVRAGGGAPRRGGRRRDDRTLYRPRRGLTVASHRADRLAWCDRTAVRWSGCIGLLVRTTQPGVPTDPSVDGLAEQPAQAELSPVGIAEVDEPMGPPSARAASSLARDRSTVLSRSG